MNELRPAWKCRPQRAHREYLAHLRAAKARHGLVSDDYVPGDPNALLGNSPEVDQALVNIMRKSGFTEEQIAKKFPATAAVTPPDRR